LPQRRICLGERQKNSRLFLHCACSSRQLAARRCLPYARDRNSGTDNERIAFAKPGKASRWLGTEVQIPILEAIRPIMEQKRQTKPIDVGPQCDDCANRDLNDATTYYFTVRAMNTMGLQSEPSNEVAHTTPDVAASRLTVNNGSGSGNYIAGAMVTVSSNLPPSGKAFDRWLDDWVVQRLGFL
jgi:hypothetical protein